MKKNLLVLFNHSISVSSQGFGFLNSEVAFLEGVGKQFDTVQFAALWEGNDLSLGHNSRSFPSNIHLVKLGIVQNSQKLVIKFLNYFSIIWQVHRLLRDKPFVYIYFPGNVPIVSAIICLIWNVGFGLYVRGEWDRGNPARRWITTKILKEAKFIISTGSEFSKILHSYNDCVEEVIPMLQFEMSDMPLERKYEIGSPVRLLFVGRIERLKGVFELVEAASRLQRSGLRVQVDIVGSGRNGIMRELSSEVRKRKLGKTVNLVGHVGEKEELKKEYEGADLFVFPSCCPEGFPRVLYEAMIFGLPIIACSLPGTAGFMVDGEHFLATKRQDVDHLVERIMHLANDISVREKLGKSGMQRMRELFLRNDDMTHAKQIARKFLDT